MCLAFGKSSPFSHLKTVGCVVPAISAKSRWVRPKISVRIWWMLMPAHNTHTHNDVKDVDAPAYLSPGQSGQHSAGMTGGDDVQLLLRKIMRLRNLTQHDLARRLKLTQPTISRLLAGAEAKYKNRAKILALARDLGVINNSERKALQETSGVRIVATVGQGGMLRPITEEEQEVVPRPPGALVASTVAAKVMGTGMMPMLDDGWTIYWDQLANEPVENLIGKLCVVVLVGGSMLVRKIYRGRSRGKYDLHAINAEPLHDQAVERVFRVVWILPQ